MVMWLRCPECGEWCKSNKQNCVKRFFNSIKHDNDKYGDYGAEIGDEINAKGLCRFIGRGINLCNFYKHLGEALDGDKYRFSCEKCNREFGVDDERFNMNFYRVLWVKADDITKKFFEIKNKPEEDRRLYIKRVQEAIVDVEHKEVILDAHVSLLKTLACCYYYFCDDSQNALLEINRALDLCDQPELHVLKGMFMKNVITPLEHYRKMNELLKIKDPYCGPIKYFEKSEILKELERSEKHYAETFHSIPILQRKFLVTAFDYEYLPESFKVIKMSDTDLSGIKFKDGFPSNNAIYVCHPYKPNLYFNSETYYEDLFEDQINEFRELLQCLGAKSITVNNLHSSENCDETSNRKEGTAGGEYKEVGADISGIFDKANSQMTAIMSNKLLHDEFPEPNFQPYVPEGLAWYSHLEEWQRLNRMRMRGQDKYIINIGLKHINDICENDVKQVNADFKILIAKGNVGGLQSSELKCVNKKLKNFELEVLFYPFSSNKKISIQEDKSPNTLKKNIFLKYIIVGVLIILLILIALFFCI